MIRNPKMVYKVYEQKTQFDQRDGSYVVEQLVAVVNTADEVLDAIKLDKWVKVKYVVQDNEKVTDHLR